MKTLFNGENVLAINASQDLTQPCAPDFDGPCLPAVAGTGRVIVTL